MRDETSFVWKVTETACSKTTNERNLPKKPRQFSVILVVKEQGGGGAGINHKLRSDGWKLETRIPGSKSIVRSDKDKISTYMYVTTYLM